MKNILLFLLFFTLLPLSLKAFIQTDTHTYILCPRTDSILKIDRLTDDTDTLYVGKRPQSMGLFTTDTSSHLFVAHSGSRDLWIIDLKTSKVLNIINFHGELRDLAIYDNWVCFVNYTHSTLIQMNACDFSGNTFCSYNFSFHPTEMKIDQHVAYILSSDPAKVLKIDLVQRTRTEINGFDYPLTLNISEGKAYVSDFNTGIIHILCDQQPLRFKGRERTTHALIEKGTLYCVSNNKKSIYLSKWHLETQRELKWTNLCDYTDIKQFKIKNKKGYVLTPYNLYIINLNNLSFDQVKNGLYTEFLDFSDNAIYLDDNKCATIPHSLILFETPYDGIQDFYYGDDTEAEYAFHAFTAAVKIQDFDTAQEHFNIALMLAHPKAYAVAAHAFLFGKWGAKENMKWVFEFVPGMDLNYFQGLELKRNKKNKE